MHVRRWLWITMVVTTGALAVPFTASADRGLDDYLKRVNIEAEADIKGFAVKLSTQFGVPQREVEVLIKKVDRPADAYMTLMVAKVANQPTEKVQREYEDNKGKGWGAIAKNLGIKPGSPEFHELKQGGVSEEDKGKVKSKKGKGKGKGHEKTMAEE